MGFLKWFQKEEAPIERFDGQRVYRLRDDESVVLDAAAPEGVLAALCPRCGASMEDALLISRLPTDHADAAVAPKVVDGWACFSCRAVSGPRFLSAERSAEWGKHGADHAHAKNFGAAEWWFTRIASSWPDYPAAWMDISTALRAWFDATTVATEKRSLNERRHAAVRRAAKELERDLRRTPPHTATSILFQYAHSAIDTNDVSEARRVAAILESIDGPPEFVARRDELTKWLATEPEVFRAAADVIGPHIQLVDERGQPVAESKRTSVAEAAATLEGHYDRHGAWRSLWIAAKGWQALGERERALAAWLKAEQHHGDVLEVVTESALACLLAERHEEAREINRRATVRMPAQSFAWSNLAMCEVLCGDIEAARAAVTHALKLEDHPRTRLLANAVETWAASGRLPKTFAEMTAGG